MKGTLRTSRILPSVNHNPIAALEFDYTLVEGPAFEVLLPQDKLDVEWKRFKMVPSESQRVRGLR